MSWGHQPQKGKVMGTIGSTLMQTDTRESYPGASHPWLGGFGIIAEGDVDNNGGIEIGMFYMPKLFYSSTQGESLVEKIKTVYITMGYRHWFTKKFSAAGAFFSSYTIGDQTVVHKSAAATNSLTTSAEDITEYGFDFSLQWEVWSDGFLSIILDGRYSQSVTAKTYESANHYLGFFGLKYPIDVN